VYADACAGQAGDRAIAAAGRCGFRAVHGFFTRAWADPRDPGAPGQVARIMPMPSRLLSAVLLLAAFLPHPVLAGQVADRQPGWLPGSEAIGSGSFPVTEAELRAIGAWIERASGRRASRPFPVILFVPGPAIDRLARQPGTVFGHYDPAANVLHLRRSPWRDRTLVWAAHELAHWVHLPDACLRDAELFAYAMQDRWLRAHGLRHLAAGPQTLGRARSLPCVDARMDELRRLLASE
jgi:hypothetical protein